MQNLQSFFGPTNVKGNLRAFVVSPGEHVQLNEHKWGCNMLQFSGAEIFAKLLAGDRDYVPSGMYLQFTNDNGAWVKPDVGRDGALEYFRTLEDVHPTYDYLRVPFMSPAAISSSNDTIFTVGNVVDFFAMSAGDVGSRPGATQLPFTNGDGSYIVGGAVIATPDWDDPEKDVILTRGYLDTIIAKPAAGEVVLQWKITCG